MFFLLSLLLLTVPPDLRVVFPEPASLSGVSSAVFIKRELVSVQERYGEMKCVVLLGEFSDMSITITSPVDYFREMFFRNPDEKIVLYPYPSMNQFYQESSQGRFWITGDVYGPYKVSETHDCYGSGPCNDSPLCPSSQDAGTCMGAVNFVREIINLADPYVDFSRYDTNPLDGYVDCIIAVHPGYGGEQSCGTIEGCNDIWSLSYSFSSARVPVDTNDGVGVDVFIIGPEKTMVPPGHPIDVGVYAHEFGHILGLIDLYDTTLRSCGIGVYGLMGYGVHGPSPSYPSAWSRLKLGWVEVEDGNSYEEGVCRYGMESIINFGKVLKIHKLGEIGSEYFLLEYRPAVGFDSDFESGGFLIWHIDEERSSNDCAWYPDSGEDPKQCHYLVALEQADGLYQLEKKEGKCNEVDIGDFYTEGDEFTPYTTPNSNYYDGDFTGVWVRNITTSPPVFTFDLGDSPVFSPPQVHSIPSPQVALGREYVYEMQISGYPYPDIEIVSMPEGATFTQVDYTFRWTPSNVGKYAFSVNLRNCLEEANFLWEVEVKAPVIEESGDTPMCLISGIIHDDRVLDILKGIRTLLLKSHSGTFFVRTYYTFSRIVLINSFLKIFIPSIIRGFIYFLPLIPYIFLFRLQKNLFRGMRKKDEE